MKLKTKQSYAQASAPKVGKILKLKKKFPNLLAKKIKNIYRTINDSRKVKPKINMTTKCSLRKKNIVPMNNNNKSKFIVSSSIHITNINNILRNIKSDIMVDFFRTDQYGIIITMNKIASTSDLQTIENYIKNIDYINFKDIGLPYLSQSKSYLKINHIFNNVLLALKL